MKLAESSDTKLNIIDNLSSFYKNRRVLITGHTGFKGTWMCMVLKLLGAKVIGYALEPQDGQSMFELCDTAFGIVSVYGDIRDLTGLLVTFSNTSPEVVIHMAAQPIVRESYKNPVYTYDVNVMGTVNILECVRNCEAVRSFVNVTTDKVYYNDERAEGFCEGDILNGYDPYSNSKSCSELVTSAYRNSFFSDGSARRCAISTCRAGNVIGGGDFAVDRIIPDCIRAVSEGKDIVVRNPHSIRPYQHVLESVVAYLYVAMMQFDDIRLSGAYNIGPKDTDCYSTGDLATLFCNKWNEKTGDSIKWINKYDGGPHEASFLKLDSSLIRQKTGWIPRWNMDDAMNNIIEWTVEYINNGNVAECTVRQINEYLK